MITEPYRDNRLLNPIERISEILFGLIMALSFTCAISIVETNRIEVKQMLIGAVGCNIAWGVIDAIMYLIVVLAQRGRDLAILNFVRKTSEPGKAIEYIAETFSPEFASVIREQSLEQMRKEIVNAPPQLTSPRLSGKDFKMALGIFLLVFVSTFPVALPFIFISQVHLALRTSNGIAIVLLFIGGWILSRYGGYHKFRTGLYLALTGAGMVFLTISLGG
jgi:hypothetical protein